MRAWATVVAVAIAGALAGCSAKDAPAPPPPDAIGFAGDAPPGDGPVVFLRSRSDAATVVLDVVASGAHDLHGAAFRLSWDPSALTFVSADASNAWPKASIAVAKEATPGQLVAVWAERGMAGMDATGEIVIGTLTFTPAPGSAGGAALAFKASRSSIIDRNGVDQHATFVAGTVAAPRAHPPR